MKEQVERRERVLAEAEWTCEDCGGQHLEVLGWRYGEVFGPVSLTEECRLRYRVNGGQVMESRVRRHSTDAPNRRVARKATVKKLLEELAAPREAREEIWKGLWEKGVRW